MSGQIIRLEIVTTEKMRHIIDVEMNIVGQIYKNQFAWYAHVQYIETTSTKTNTTMATKRKGEESKT